MEWEGCLVIVDCSSMALASLQQHAHASGPLLYDRGTAKGAAELIQRLYDSFRISKKPWYDYGHTMVHLPCYTTVTPWCMVGFIAILSVKSKRM